VRFIKKNPENIFWVLIRSCLKMITFIAVPTFDRDGLMINKPMALAKTRQTIWAKAHYHNGFYPLTSVNGNEKLIQVIFKQFLRDRQRECKKFSINLHTNLN
jgi:hypothetical protein